MTTKMPGEEFTYRAAHATDHLSDDLDIDATFAAVRTQHRRHQRRRARTLAIVPVASVLAIAGIMVPSILDSGPGEQPTASGTQSGPALSFTTSYAFAEVPAEKPPLAELEGGLTLHYLPPGATGEHAPADAGYPRVITEADDFPADQLGMRIDCQEFTGHTPLEVCVSTVPGLTVESYLQSHWFEGEETTVNGYPALVNVVDIDDASGILFSPEPGMVVEVHMGSADSDELRKVFEQMSL